MCLAVPAQLIEHDAKGNVAVADLHGNRLRISTALVPDARAGDWVLVHAGFAIQRLHGDEAAETFAILEDIARDDEGSGP